MTTRIWWLASYPKSGNTWLRMFLSAYRNAGRVNINKPGELLLDDIQPYFYQVASPVPVAALHDMEKMLLRPAALLHLCKVNPPSVPLLVKTHTANAIVAGVEAIPAILTHGAVYLLRDPRDVAVSYAEHRGCTIDEIIACMARRDHIGRRPPVYQHIASWSDHVRHWTTPGEFPVLAVRYEDMIEDATTIFRQVLAFLHHELDEDLLARSVAAASFPALRAQEERAGFREKVGGKTFFTRGRAGGWREILTPAQVRAIEEVHGAVMRDWGYELSEAEAA